MDDVTVDICLVMRDEHHLLEEWIHHYKKLGANKIWIYDHQSEPKLKLENFPHAVEIIRWEQKFVHNPISVYDHCKTHLSRATWLGCFDLDEFVVLKRHRNLSEFLTQYAEFDAVCLNWKVFGPGDNVSFVSSQIHSCRYRLPQHHEYNNLVKSFFKTTRPLRYYPSYRSEACAHRPYAEDKSIPIRVVNTHIVDMATTHSPTRWDIAYVNHYICRSVQDWECRLKRGSGTPSGCPRDWNFFNNLKTQATIFDDTIIQLYYS